MASKKKRFADDGWAFWVDGEDTSTVYINDWINPKGKSFVDIAVRIRGVKSSTALNVYVPFSLTKDEVEDVSLKFDDRNILQATFSSACIVDYMKNKHLSEIAYKGKTVDIVHISTLDYTIEPLADGTLLNFDLKAMLDYFDNDEAYFIWRIPHKTLDDIFKPRVDVGNTVAKLRDLITTPVVFEKYGYSVRINESRLLPDEINKIGSFHRQKLKKAVFTISIDEKYELNDGNCYRIHRLEENLYKKYLPENFKGEDVITYQWQQNREYNMLGHFNFYNYISRNSVSMGSMFLYMFLLIAVSVMSDFIAETIKMLIGFGR